MSKQSILLAGIFSLLLSPGCEKVELPPPVEEDPVFTLGISWADSSSLQLSAGEDRYYHFAGFEADSQDVFTFYGRFAQLDCLDQCGPSFAIHLRDDQVSVVDQPDFPGFLGAGLSIPFRGPVGSTFDTIYQYLYQFESTSNTGGVLLPQVWVFEDSITMAVTDPLLVRTTAQPYNACLEIGNPAQGCYSRQCQTVVTDSLAALSVVIQPDSNTTFLDAIPVGGQPPYAYQWNTGPTTPFIQNFQPGGTYCVTVTDAIGAEGSVCVQIPFSPALPVCVASFGYQFSVETDVIPVTGDPLQLKTVILEYVDKEGVIFRSDLQAQAPGAFFVIEEVTPFEENENGYPTLRISARFSGVLFAENGDTLEVANGQAIFAVAYGQ